MYKRLKSIFPVLAIFGLLELISLFKVNILLGAKTAVFSGFAVAGPLVGLYAGTGLMVGIFALRRLVRGIFLGTSLLSPFALYLPTLAAGYYLKSHSWLIRLVVPLACMVLFMVHPVGGQAWYYALYWLVPVAVYLIPFESQFVQALGATFVQHAVGSVLWLYFMPTTAAIWTMLLPIVFVERILCAVGMVMVMRMVSYTQGIMAGSVSKLFSTLRIRKI